MEWQRDVSDSDATEFVEGIKLDIFQDQVFVFTPKGDIKDLPAGATPLDFAYRIHTDIGHRTIGAKVNNRLVPLDYRLKNGDIVEIVTTKGEHGPSRDWLNIVRTSARPREDPAMVQEEGPRREHRPRPRVAGARAPPPRPDEHPGRSASTGSPRSRKTYQHESVDDFYAAIGYGAISTQQVVIRLGVLDDGETSLPTIAPPQPARTGGVRVKGVGDLLVRFAKCCHPIPGDPIQGFITRGKGITVHLMSCPTVLNEREVSRLIDVEWEAAPAQTYPIAIRVEAYDRTGLLSDITQVMAENKVNILAANVAVNPDHTAHRGADDPDRVRRAAGQGDEPRRAAQGRDLRPARARLERAGTRGALASAGGRRSAALRRRRLPSGRASGRDDLLGPVAADPGVGRQADGGADHAAQDDRLGDAVAATRSSPSAGRRSASSPRTPSCRRSSSGRGAGRGPRAGSSCSPSRPSRSRRAR